MVFSAWGPSFSSAASSDIFPSSSSATVSSSAMLCFIIPFSLFSYHDLFHLIYDFLTRQLFSSIGLLLLLIFSSFSRHHKFHLFLYSSQSDCLSHPFSFNLSILLLSQSVSRSMFPLFPLCHSWPLSIPVLSVLCGILLSNFLKFL